MDHKISNSFTVKVRVVNSFCCPERLILDLMKNTDDPNRGGCDSKSLVTALQLVSYGISLTCFILKILQKLQ